jgi:hydroxyproline O-arabinosyltransferase
MVRSAPRELTTRQQLLTLLVGIAAGLIAGYVLMGTAHAIFESGIDSHNAHAIRADTGRSLAVSGVAGQSPHPAGTIHTLVTGNGSPYQNFQLRIMHGTYKIVQKMPGGEKLTGFTRILHRTTDDNLMTEIPTFRAQPLNPACDTWCAFPVSDRPNAVMQWVKAAEKDPSMILGQWLLMLESDYVWMKPLPAPDANKPGTKGYLYAFDYIMPNHPVCRDIIRRLSGGLDPARLPNSGPAPVMLRFSEWQALGPLWEQLTATIEADAAAKEALGWVREMYAFDIAIGQTAVKYDIAMAPASVLISQPPHDHALGAAALFHYTWGTIYKQAGREIWKFDKRFYTAPEHAARLPLLPLPPPWNDAIVLQDGMPVPKALHDTTVAMLEQMNRAVTAAAVISFRT